MALILCIETATEICSAALFRDEKLLAVKESAARNVHSSMLTTFIDEIIKTSGCLYSDLSGVAVSMGPGSYTGLRIGVATAKGLCYALDKPLIAVGTLQEMSAGLKYEVRSTKYEVKEVIASHKPKIKNQKSKILFCPMIDARRMEVYSAVFDHEGKEVREVRAEIIDEFSFQEVLADHTVVFGGEGAEKCKPALGHHPNAVFIDGFQASAKHMIGIALEKFHLKQFENLAYFEPFYLKDFVAGKPRVKGLN